MPETLSPYARTLGLRLEGAHVVMPFADGFMGRPGFLHGGAIAGLLECAGTMAVAGALPADAAITSISVTVDYLRGGAHADTFAEARLVRMGRRIANVIVTAWQDDPGKPIASANIKFLIARA